MLLARIIAHFPIQISAFIPFPFLSTNSAILFFFPNLAITPDPESQQSRTKAKPTSKQADRCCGVWDILPWPYLCPTYLHRPLGRPSAFFAVPLLVHGDDGVWAGGSSAPPELRGPRSKAYSYRTYYCATLPYNYYSIVVPVRATPYKGSKQVKFRFCFCAWRGRQGHEHGMGAGSAVARIGPVVEIDCACAWLGRSGEEEGGGREVGGRTNPGIHGDSGRWMEGWTCYAIGRCLDGILSCYVVCYDMI